MNEPLLDRHRELFPHFADEIDAFYRQQFRYKKSCADARFPTVGIRRAAIDLYLRFEQSEVAIGHTVVIARIGFRHQRQGHGTRLLAKLVAMSEDYGIRSIGVEQTGPDPSIQNFVRKFGFNNHVDQQNWILPVDSLKERLQQVS
ncbi:GNAT family N-acetyltransferase [Massilia sp. HP4]|uniref:GNAT family N-acetyltransferase n=1 Tax=Massilia sp. HP4 TaxID=2562316 RepID=UPI0010C01274|nr:GNAT family N-acetyltransferase [Massilia sp. HP4]